MKTQKIITSWLISALHNQIVDLPVHVCIGPAHPAPNRVVALCHEVLPNAIIYRSPSSLIEPVSLCALALTAGGTTCYELASSGIAMAVIALEDHQLTMRDALVGKAAALSLGSYDELDPENVQKVLTNCVNLIKLNGSLNRHRRYFKSRAPRI